MRNSKISWTNDTWNPFQGCTKISAGCVNCYMYRDKVRYGQDPTKVVKSSPATFNAPLTKFKGPLVFTCSWSDFFHDDINPAWVDDAWDIIRKTPHLIYQILTKRPENIKDLLPGDWGNGWPNVWLGVTVEAKKYLWRLETLDKIPAMVKFVSWEPALEYVDFTTYAPMLDWVIAGGESGPNYRPAKIEWFQAVRDDCIKNSIPFFFKQHGGTKKINGIFGGDELDGQQWHQFPTR